MNQAKNTYLIGFSGGADSTAALLFVLEKMQKNASGIVAVHFNHHLRGGESDAEAENAAKFAAEKNVPFRLIDLNIAPGNNLESRARRARLDAWKKLCAEYENPVVITGHHRDDCIENMFLRIGRGSNVSGLTGLQLYSEVEGVRFFRPLLTVSREDIEAFLKARGVGSWAVDSSNLQCEYSRNILRNRILPELYRIFPGGRKAVEQTLSNLSFDAACLDKMAMTHFYGDGKEEFRRTEFWSLYADEPALTVRMLRLLCREFFNDDTPLSAAAAERFTAMITEKKNGRAVLDKNRTLVFSGGEIYPETAVPPEISWQWRKEPQICWGNWRFTVKKIGAVPEEVPLTAALFNAEKLPDVLNIGSPAAGEKMVPFGRKNPEKIKNLRIKRGVPAYPAVPVVRISGGCAVWVPTVRHSGEYPAEPGNGIVMFFAEKV